jgi:hypothetical protein
MNRKSLLGKVSVAIGLSLVVLSMGTFITQASAGCCEGSPTCNGTSPTGPGGCAAGFCNGTGLACWTGCTCGENFFTLKCYCD